MTLTGKQFEQLSNALIDAFTYSTLEIMLRVRLERRLDRIAPPAELQTVVYDLISTAEREGWVFDLAREAHKWVPDNSTLAAVAASLSPQGASASGALQDAGSGEPTSTLPVPAIDPDKVPLRQIRVLLRNSYSATTLRQFCRDRDIFRDVLFRVGPNQGLDEVIDELLEHCRTRLLWQELLEEIAQESPRHYRRFLQDI